MPASTLAVWSASSRSDGVPAGSATSVRTAASQARRRPTGSAIQRAGAPARRRSQLRRNAAAGRRPPPAEPVVRRAAPACTATVRQPASAANKPSTAFCKTGEW